MWVAGIDYSTHAVDIVRVHLDGLEPPTWERRELRGNDAFDRTRDMHRAFPAGWASFWDDVVAVGIEHPAGKFGTGKLLRIQGAILACIPARMLVEPLPPAKWRKLVGLKGNASKTDVAEWVVNYGPPHADPTENRCARYGCFCCTWEQDAFDAYAIAVATRTLLEREKTA